MDPILMSALLGFATSKLTGQSTKKSLRNALLGGAIGGITSGFGAGTSQAASAVNQMEQFGGNAMTGTLSNNSNGIMSNIGNSVSNFGSSLPGGSYSGFLNSKIPGMGDLTYGMGGAIGIGGGLLYKTFADAAKAPKKTLFYGANTNYANPAIYNQVGPNKFQIGQYDQQGNYIGATQMPGAKDYVPPEAVYASGQVPGMPYKVAEQMITAKEGGLATLKGIKKYAVGGQVLPSKLTHNEEDMNNYIRANGHIIDNTGYGDKDEDTVLAQLADGEFVTRTDGVLGAGILAGADPKNFKQMREKGAKYFYEQQARFKRIFDLLQQSREKAVA